MPIIDPNFHAVEADREMSIKGVRLAREILAQSELSRHIEREFLPGAEANTDTEILAYIKQYASVDYHPVGTCKMGRDAMAVVDAQLRVHGLEGTRIVDSSIMPNLISGNTNAPSIMIGEKGAAMIRKESALIADLDDDKGRAF